MNIFDKYLPLTGEGNNKAQQIVTAINKLIYRYYNDGDVYDNTYALEGYYDITSYANWLYYNVEGAADILDKIANCTTYKGYEKILKALENKYLNDEFLSKQENINKIGSIYDCEGRFIFEEN